MLRVEVVVQVGSGQEKVIWGQFGPSVITVVPPSFPVVVEMEVTRVVVGGVKVMVGTGYDRMVEETS